MVEIKTNRISENEVECTANMEGRGEDLIYEAYYAISGIVRAIKGESPEMKKALMMMLAANDEWMHRDRNKPSLGDVLGMIAKEGRFN